MHMYSGQAIEALVAGMFMNTSTIFVYNQDVYEYEYYLILLKCLCIRVLSNTPNMFMNTSTLLQHSSACLLEQGARFIEGEEGTIGKSPPTYNFLGKGQRERATFF